MRSSKRKMRAAATDLNRSLARVGRALSERNDQLVLAMIEHIRDEVPAYSHVDSSVFDRVHVLATTTARAISTALCEHTPVRRQDVPIIGEQAADRLRLGIDLDAFLHAYRAALFFYWDTAVEEAGRLRLSRDATRAVGRFVLDSIDTITTHAAEAYLREDNRIRTQTGRAVRDLIESLIAGRALPDRARHPAAPALDPARPMQLIVARATRSEPDLNTALVLARDTLAEHLGLGTAAPLSTIRQQEVVVIAAGVPPTSRLHEAARALRERHGVELSVGVSGAPTGFPAVARAYREAALALSYATSRRPVVALTELRALQLVLLAAADPVRELIAEQARPLGGLTGVERATTIATIAAFAAADMSISQTARTLGLHVNTVRYRLARIATLTGLDPRTFAGLADLHCIVELAQAQATA